MMAERNQRMHELVKKFSTFVGWTIMDVVDMKLGEARFQSMES